MKVENVVLSILIPFGVGLYIYTMIRFKEQAEGKNKLIGWEVKQLEKKQND